MANEKWVKFINGQNLKYYRGNIVYQASYHGRLFRYNLFKVDNKHFNEKTKSLLRDDCLYDVEERVKSIDTLAYDVHKAFNRTLETLPKGKAITKHDIDNYLVLGTNTKQVNANDGLVANFQQWIDKYNEDKRQGKKNKGQEVREIGILPGTKDFISCLNLISDFEYDNYLSCPIQLRDIDSNFISELLEYCYDERGADDEHEYKTQGNLVNKTIQKRFDCLFQYLNDITHGNLPNGIKKPHLDVIDKEIIRLDRDEIQQLIGLPLTNPQEIKVRDYFLFLCFTGLRFSDFCKLNKTYYNEEENHIKLKSNKTFSDCQIPLHPLALEIAKKYDWNFHDYTNQGLNRALHTLFEEYNLFDEDVTIEYMQQGRKTYTKKKRELISCHAGRRTFISRMIESGADIYDVMSCTGHKKVETLRFYIDKFGKARKQRLVTMINQIG